MATRLRLSGSKADDKADVDDNGNKAIGIGVIGKLAVGKTSWVASAKAGVLHRQPARRSSTRPSLTSTTASQTSRELDRLHHRRMYRDVVGPFLGELSPILKGVLTADVNLATRIADLYFWALIDGNWPLAMVLWKRSERPIHLAALGAYTCERIAKEVFIGKAELHDQQQRLSQIAEGVLDMATDDKTAFEAALEMDAAPSVEKALHAHRHCAACASSSRTCSLRATARAYWTCGGAAASADRAASWARASHGCFSRSTSAWRGSWRGCPRKVNTSRFWRPRGDH